MAGIVGFVDRSLKTDKETNIKEMSKKLRHRGPDLEGYFIDNEISLGFRGNKFTVNDIEQPIYNETGKLLIIFDGEIYNANELRNELKIKGHSFRTNSSAEVILHGYEQYESEFLNKISGKYAFVIWDTMTKTLFGARDTFGIKPFYYTEMNGSLMFASEIKSLLAHQSISRRLNYHAVKPFLTFQYSVLPETLFKGIRKLEPGHCFTYARGILKIFKYFTPEFRNDGKIEEQYLEEIEATTKNIIDNYKKDNLITGTFLSGGIDSSYISAFLKPNKTFSVGYSQTEINNATKISSALNIENVSKIITPEEFFNKIKDIQYILEEPLADLSIVPFYHLTEMAKDYVKVIMTGDGSDELFAGYDSYITTKKDQNYQKIIPNSLKNFLGNYAKTSSSLKNREFYMKNGLSLEEYYIGQTFAFSEYEAGNILTDMYKEAPGFKDITKPYYDKTKNKDEIIRKQYIDINFRLPQEILLKLDKISSHHSLRLKLPYLDKNMWILASGIPTSLKTKNNISKYLLRESSKRIFPEELSNQEKISMTSPFGTWIKQEKYMTIVKNEFEKNYVKDIFNQEDILKLLRDHFNSKKNNAIKIWTRYSFLIWYNVYFVEQR